MSWIILFGSCLFMISLESTPKHLDFIFKCVQIASYYLYQVADFTFCYILWREIKVKLTYFCLSLSLCYWFYFSFIPGNESNVYVIKHKYIYKRILAQLSHPNRYPVEISCSMKILEIFAVKLHYLK